MTSGKVSEQNVAEALAGKRVVIPLAGGGVIRLFYRDNKLHLTESGQALRITATDQPGERADEFSPG